MGLKKRILVLTSRFPYPILAGDALRISLLCRALAAKYELTLLSFSTKKNQELTDPALAIFSQIKIVYKPKWLSYLHVLFGIFSRRPLQCCYYQSTKFKSAFRELIPSHDAVVAHLLRTGQYVQTEKPKILEMTDALSLFYERSRRYASFSIKSLIYRVERKRILAAELAALVHFDLVSLVSPSDKEYFRQYGEYENLQVHTLGIDVAKYKHIGPSPGSVVAFIGNMRSLQNIEACEYFTNAILPLLRQEIPEIKFRIIGFIGKKEQKRFSALEGVEVTGRVESIATAIGDAFMAVCPTLIATGVQTKVLEYLAFGKPAVITPVVLTGLSLKAEKQLLVAATPEEFVVQIKRLYDDRALCARLAAAGRIYVEKHYDWKNILTRFVADVDQLL